MVCRPAHPALVASRLRAGRVLLHRARRAAVGAVTRSPLAAQQRRHVQRAAGEGALHVCGGWRDAFEADAADRASRNNAGLSEKETPVRIASA